MCGHGQTGIPDVLPEALNAWNDMPPYGKVVC